MLLKMKEKAVVGFQHKTLLLDFSKAFAGVTWSLLEEIQLIHLSMQMVGKKAGKMTLSDLMSSFKGYAVQHVYVYVLYL